MARFPLGAAAFVALVGRAALAVDVARAPEVTMAFAASGAMALAAGVLAILAPSPALAQASPCDDVTFANAMRVRYPQEIVAIGSDEAARRTAWNARWDAMSAQLVAARVTTADAQSSFRLALWRRADVATLDAQIAAAETDFRERNIALQGAPVIARLDPLRPQRAACLLSLGALDVLRHKVDLESQQWSLVDGSLLDEAARLGVRFAP